MTDFPFTSDDDGRSGASFCSPRRIAWRRAIRKPHFEGPNDEPIRSIYQCPISAEPLAQLPVKPQSEMGSGEVNDFLTYLAVTGKIAASTQNQAFSALLFPFTKWLDIPLTIDAVRAKQPDRLPVVLSTQEVRRVLQELPAGNLFEELDGHDVAAFVRKWCGGTPNELQLTSYDASYGLHPFRFDNRLRRVRRA